MLLFSKLFFFLGPHRKMKLLRTPLSQPKSTRNTHLGRDSLAVRQFMIKVECFCVMYAQVSKDRGCDNTKVVYLSPSELRTWAETPLITRIGLNIANSERCRRGWRTRMITCFLFGCAATKPLRCRGKRGLPMCQTHWPYLSWWPPSHQPCERHAGP